VKRRGFLGSIFAAGFAPAFVGSSVLMPVRKLARSSVDLVLPTQIALASGGALMFDEPLLFVRGDIVTAMGTIRLFNEAGTLLMTTTIDPVSSDFTGVAHGITTLDGVTRLIR
jgi:hypothetical protein